MHECEDTSSVPTKSDSVHDALMRLRVLHTTRRASSPAFGQAPGHQAAIARTPRPF